MAYQKDNAGTFESMGLTLSRDIFEQSVNIKKAQIFAEVLKELVPPSYLSEMTCSLLADPHPERSPVPKCDIAICTRFRELIELYRGLPVISCNVGIVATDIDRHCVVRDSRLVKVYYVMQGGDNVVVVDRTESKMEIVKQIKNVDNFEITDCDNSGVASIVIQYLGTSEPEVLDLSPPGMSVNDSSPVPDTLECNEILQVLNHELRDMKQCVDDRKKALEEKKMLGQEVVKELSDEFYFGRGSKEYKKTQQPPLTVTDTWSRTHNGQLVLGVNLKSTSEITSQNVDLLLVQKGNDLSYRTKLCALQKNKMEQPSVNRSNLNDKETELEQDGDGASLNWFCVAGVKPKSNATIAAVLELPEFVDSCFENIHATVVYECEDNKLQSAVHTFTIRSSDVVNNSMAITFDGTNDDYDALTILCTSRSITMASLHLERPQRPGVLEEALVGDLSFRRIAGYNCHFLHGGGVQHAAEGAYVVLKQVSDTLYTVQLFTRDDSQLYLLLNALHETLPFRIAVLLMNNDMKSQFLIKNEEAKSKDESRMDVGYDFSDNTMTNCLSGTDIINLVSVLDDEIECAKEYLKRCIDGQKKAGCEANLDDLDKIQLSSDVLRKQYYDILNKCEIKTDKVFERASKKNAE